MKAKFARHFSFGVALVLAWWPAGPGVIAQTPALLSVQTYAGLTVTGAVGTVYSVECVHDLAQTNTPGAWHCLEFLRLPASPYLWADKSMPVSGKRFYRAVVIQRPTNMVFIPPGTFRMGSPTNEVGRDDREGPQTDMIISSGFWMAKYEVTQGEYLALMGNNPSFHTGRTSLPVDSVTWYDATNYCGKLTERERAAGRIAANSVYRLPTEAEWEYACRALTSTRFSYGDDPGYTNLGNYACSTSSPVGQKLPNQWGLYDMYGNVWEWCQDWYGAYPGGLVSDPQGPAQGPFRITRGGPADYGPRACRSASRGGLNPDAGSLNGGFRPVLVPGQP